MQYGKTNTAAAPRESRIGIKLRRRMLLLGCIVLWCCMMPASATAQEASESAPDARFADILHRFAHSPQFGCDYRQTTKSSHVWPDEERVGTYSSSDGWRLLSVDGQEPTAEQSEEYRSHWRAMSNRPLRGIDLAKLVSAKHAKLVEETPDTLTYETRPGAGQDWEFQHGDAVVSHVVFDTRTLHPLRLTTTNVDSLSVMVGVRLHDYRYDLTFHVDEAHNILLPLQEQRAAEGRAFLVKRVEFGNSTDYADFDCSEADRGGSDAAE